MEFARDAGCGPDKIPEPIIRERLRALIDAGVLRQGAIGCLWEWTCHHRHPCSGCGAAITYGEIEVEVSTQGGVVLFLHRRCLDLWAQMACPRPRELT